MRGLARVSLLKTKAPALALAALAWLVAVAPAGALDKTFTIHNDGDETLEITNIVEQNGSAWLSVASPGGLPLLIAPSGQATITVSVEPALAPDGAGTDRLLVLSNDADNSPYADGVYVNWIRPSITPTPLPTPTPSPSLSPSLSVSPSPSVTASPSASPSPSLSPTPTPILTPTLTPTPTPSPTPTLAPSPTPTPAFIEKTFTIHNDGDATLEITSIAKQSGAVWLSVIPPSAYPISIDPAGQAAVTARVVPSLVPGGQASERLMVYSNDADSSPYPAGVYIVYDDGEFVVTRAVICQYLVEALHVPAGSLSRLDVNADGVIDAADVLAARDTTPTPTPSATPGGGGGERAPAQ